MGQKFIIIQVFLLISDDWNQLYSQEEKESKLISDNNAKLCTTRKKWLS